MSTTTNSAPATAGARRRVLIAAGIGNFIEWYDFVVYGFLATVISPLFFPSADPVAALLATFAVFGVGFVMRPVGALVLGHFGDRIGRRDTLMIVIGLMALGTTILGLAPTYAQAGVLGPIALVIGRAVQGFSVGGEFAGGSSFMVEYAPPSRRGFYGSWQIFGQMGGALAGAAVALATLALPAEALNSWGWRAAFLVAVPLIFVAFYIRLRLDESPRFAAVRAAGGVVAAPLVVSLRSHSRTLLIMVGIGCLPGVGTYVLFVAMPSHLAATQGIAPAAGLVSTIIGLAVFTVVTPILGKLSDRIGRRPILLAGAVGTVVLSYPVYLVIGSGTFWLIVVAQAVGGLCIALASAVMPTVFVELFPTAVRYSSISIAYAVSTAVFAGTAPFVVTYLVASTGDPFAPAYYLVASGLIAVAAGLAIPETFRAPLPD